MRILRSGSSCCRSLPSPSLPTHPTWSISSISVGQHLTLHSRLCSRDEPSEQRDFVGAYNAFRQAYGYDPVNELAVSEMDRMLRLQSVKDGTSRSSDAPPRMVKTVKALSVPASGKRRMRELATSSR